MRRQLRVGDDGNVELIATADGHFLTDRSHSRPHPAIHSPSSIPGTWRAIKSSLSGSENTWMFEGNMMAKGGRGCWKRSPKKGKKPVKKWVESVTGG